ncbi:hypothetical protein JCM8547_004538 [Rhodosporidiobolus lusitaniae]
MSAVNVISNLDSLTKLLKSKSAQLTVIDFHATWCGPCKAIAPKFEQLASQYRNVTFCKVDVDQAQDIARAYAVSAMPTFVFVRNERKVHQVRGADVASLEAGIKQYSAGTGSAGECGTFPGQGQTLAGTPIPTEAPPPGQGGYVKVIVFVALLYLWFKYAGKGAEKGE